MSSGVAIVVARLLFPVGAIVFAISFYLAIEGRGRSERLFPSFLIAGILLIAVVVIAGELVRLVAVRGASRSDVGTRLDRDGFGEVGWRRSVMIAAACLLYVFAIERLGLILTAFLVYMVCAVTLIPDKSQARDWLSSLIGAVVAAAVFDLVFVEWLGLPVSGLPAY